MKPNQKPTNHKKKPTFQAQAQAQTHISISTLLSLLTLTLSLFHFQSSSYPSKPTQAKPEPSSSPHHGGGYGGSSSLLQKIPNFHQLPQPPATHTRHVSITLAITLTLTIAEERDHTFARSRELGLQRPEEDHSARSMASEDRSGCLRGAQRGPRRPSHRLRRSLRLGRVGSSGRSQQNHRRILLQCSRTLRYPRRLVLSHWFLLSLYLLAY